MKNTKKKNIRKNKSKKKNDKFIYLKKTLGHLYNKAMFEKIPLIFRHKSLMKYEKERFSYVYSLYRSGGYLYFNDDGKIEFNDKWFPESEEDSINEAKKSLESIDWKKKDPEKKEFYEMKELNERYSNYIYKKNLLNIIKFSKL